MKTKKQLEDLSAKIGEAIRNYRDAVEENLRELAHPVSVQGDNDDIVGIDIDTIFDNSIFHYTIDQIKWDGDEIKVHYTHLNYTNEDEWQNLYMFGDAIDYVLEAIQWVDRDKLMKVDGGVWSGTANEVYSFCSSEITLYFIHKNGRIEDVAWHQTIDDFIDIPGVFAVEKTQYDMAIRQIEDHYKGIEL